MTRNKSKEIKKQSFIEMLDNHLSKLNKTLSAEEEEMMNGFSEYEKKIMKGVYVMLKEAKSTSTGGIQEESGERRGKREGEGGKECGLGEEEGTEPATQSQEVPRGGNTRRREGDRGEGRTVEASSRHRQEGRGGEEGDIPHYAIQDPNNGAWQFVGSPSWPEIRNTLDLFSSEIDECHQRQRKGTLIVSSQERLQDGKKIESLFGGMWPKKKGEREENGPFFSEINVEEEERDLKKILSLIKEEYGVEIPVGHVTACHWLPTGSYIIRVDMRSPSSPWRKLITAIQSGNKAGNNLFVNFNLTKRRLALLKEVRDMKRKSKIQKYCVDENGAISMRLNSSDNANIKGVWVKITQHYSKAGFIVPTKSVGKVASYGKK